MILKGIAVACGALSLVGVNQTAKEGFVSSPPGTEYVILDNGYQVWTQRIGNGPIQILLLHGGPGSTHEYLECFEDRFPKDQFQLIFYDQLGSGNSDHPDDVRLWTMDRFCDEVEQVRSALKLEDFYLYGQSWGGWLAIEYAITHPGHLKGLILSNTTASLDSYVSYINELLAQLPEQVQKDLSFYEEKGDIHNPEYEKIMFEQVYTRHICRSVPWPDALNRAGEHLNKQVYETMHGPRKTPHEFTVTGNYKNWNRWNDLHCIRIPTLIISGRYDTMNPADTTKMGQIIPNARTKICENGSHNTMFDDPENYFSAILDFLFKTS